MSCRKEARGSERGSTQEGLRKISLMNSSNNNNNNNKTHELIKKKRLTQV